MATHQPRADTEKEENQVDQTPTAIKQLLISSTLLIFSTLQRDLEMVLYIVAVGNRIVEIYLLKIILWGL